MKRTYEEVKTTCDENTVDWLLPNKILNRHIHELGLIHFKRTGVSNIDEWNETMEYIRKKSEIPAAWLVIHWTNEEFRMNKIDKNHLRLANSTLGSLLMKYNVPLEKRKSLKVLRNEIILLNPVKRTKEFIMKIFYFFYSHIIYYFKDENERRRMRGEKDEGKQD